MAEFGFAPSLPLQQRGSDRAQFLSGRAVGLLLPRDPRVSRTGISSTRKTPSSSSKSPSSKSTTHVVVVGNHSSGHLKMWQLIVVVVVTVVVVVFVIALLAYWSKERKLKRRRTNEGVEHKFRWARVLRQAAEAAVLIGALRALINKLRDRRRDAKTGAYNQVRGGAVAAGAKPAYHGTEEDTKALLQDRGGLGIGGSGERYEPMAGQLSPGHMAMAPSPTSPFYGSGATGEKTMMMAMAAGEPGGTGAAAEYYSDGEGTDSANEAQQQEGQGHHHARRPSAAGPAPVTFPAATAAPERGQPVYQNPHAMSAPAEQRELS